MASLIQLCKICPKPYTNQVVTIRSFPKHRMVEDVFEHIPLCSHCAKLYDEKYDMEGNPIGKLNQEV
jgi:hypothetical protein